MTGRDKIARAVFEVSKAIATRKLALLVGAGVSKDKPTNVPLYNELARIIYPEEWGDMSQTEYDHWTTCTDSGRNAARMAPFIMGRHHARKHQGRDHRNLSEARPRPRRTPSRQLRPALQPLTLWTMIPRFLHRPPAHDLSLTTTSSQVDFHG